MHNKLHTEESKQKMRESFLVWKNSPGYKLFLEGARKRGKESGTKFKKGHKPLSDGMNLLSYQKGKDHWNWKGGITEESHTLRNTKNYKDWRNKVFYRDSFICQGCEIKGGYLEADHHPVPWCVIFEEKNEELMWDISNGRTLCRKCHDKTKKFWKDYYAKP